VEVLIDFCNAWVCARNTCKYETDGIATAMALGGQSMLGPALTHLLHTLASIKEKDRTDEQKAIFAELRLLFMAFPPSSEDKPHLSKTAQLLARPDFNIAGVILEPYQPPPPSGKKCKTCGQNFPVMTQPKS
jgi:hypothetical protein